MASRRPAPAPGDYLLEVASFDLRQRATIVAPKGSGKSAKFAIELHEDLEFGGSFNEVGPNAEWRTKQGDTTPYALILRHAFDKNPENGKAGKQHYLAVVKISGDKMCLAGWVEASKNSANANTIARKIADDARIQRCPKTVSITTK
jgi:hypothetical protein